MSNHTHDHEHSHENDHDYEELEKVELIGDDGSVETFYIIASLFVDDVEYAILTSEEDLLSENEEQEVVVFRVTEQDGEFSFEGVEDDEEVEAVLEAYEELLKEQE